MRGGNDMNEYEKKHHDAMSKLQKQLDGYTKKKNELMTKLKDVDELIEITEGQMKSLDKMYASIKKKQEEIDAKWNDYMNVLPKKRKKDSASEEPIILDSLSRSLEGDSSYGN